MKKLVRLEDAVLLSKSQQRAINGGNGGYCSDQCHPEYGGCPEDQVCFQGTCDGCPTYLCKVPDGGDGEGGPFES